MPSKLEDYEIIGRIGSGSYGTCKKIRRKSDGKTLVWKELNYGEMTEHEKQMLVSEVNLLRELKHDHIVRYYDRVIDRKNAIIYIVMEFCEGGDLAALISRRRAERKYFDEDFIWKVFFQLCLALQECHKRRGGGAVLHRDLKPANVFLDKSNYVKLGDFGLARVLQHNTSFAKTFVGTPYYMSPEQISEKAYNEKSDIWSLGCLLYELCALVPPFNAINQKALAVKIRDGRFRRIPGGFSEDLAQCVTSMLQVQRERRPSIEDLLRSSALAPRVLQHQLEKERILLKKREEEVKRKEIILAECEEELNRREANLVERESTVKKIEQKLANYGQDGGTLKKGKGPRVLTLPEKGEFKKRVTFSDQTDKKQTGNGVEYQDSILRKGLRY
eukprot:m.72488 g.72488  ORF g.72488 m.72488 type:complete len:388 (+) comp35805_c0_seq3:32-1195(+)